MRIAVIGGLASGPAAAAEAVRSNAGAEVVLFEQNPHISVGSCEIPYFVADQIRDSSTLEVLTPREFEKTRGATVRVNHRVETIDPEKRKLVVQSLVHGSRQEETFDRFILATGARAKSLNVEGEEADGVFSLRGLTDAISLKAWLKNEPVHHVVIAGGGFVGLEMAEAVHRLGLRASIIDPSGKILRHVLSERMASPLFDAMKNAGVSVRAERITSIQTDSGNRVESLRTDKGERIGCQAVIVAVGIEPRTELAKKARIKIGLAGGISVDDQMRTSRRNVWACGDGIEVSRVVDKKSILWPLSPVARRTARVAARNAAGVKSADRFKGVTPSIAVKAFGIEVAAAGLTLDEAKKSGFDAEEVQINHWSRVSTMPGAERLHVAYVFEQGSGRILGGSLVGPEGAALRANVLVPWIRAEATVREIAQEMDLVYTPPIAPATDPLKIAASAALRVMASSTSRRPTK
ncbi:MAG: FAD-dependent oxidoreductase [Rubricoccaceae bacterium]|nr:FAD-dependent oxidoreductase [Rubricoccaceae bacterium]